MNSHMAIRNGQRALVPHVLLFPLPLQGTVTTYLWLAELLCLADLNITFLITHHIHHRLGLHSDALGRLQRYPKFHFKVFHDGLPEDNLRGYAQVSDLFMSAEVNSSEHIKEMLAGTGSSEGLPVTCMVAERLTEWMFDVAKKNGVAVLLFDTVNTSCLWIHLNAPGLLEAGDLPLKGNNLDDPIMRIPGTNSLLRQRDLPSYFRPTDPLHQRMHSLTLIKAEYPVRSQGIILNTFDELERPLLSEISTMCPNLYYVGPLHLHLRHKLNSLHGDCIKSSLSLSNSMWEEDRSCIEWLDGQLSNTVIFVGIGSYAVMTEEQHMEIWYGLINSGVHFLWVKRPGSITARRMIVDRDKDGSSQHEETVSDHEYLIEGTKKRGYIVSWAPQVEVLAHRAVRGFLTHSGWNSTMESIVEGVPMICWPQVVDQQPISRFVSEVWKVGIDMKDSCDRVVVEKMVRELMDLRKDEFHQRSKELANLAAESVREGGSSYSALDRLIDDIKLFKL